MKGDRNYAYVVQPTIAELTLAKSSDSPVYVLLKESLVAGYSVYVFNYKSPYLDRGNSFLLFENEYGLSSYNSGKRILVGGTKKDSDGAEKVAMSLNHLQSSFYILFCGYVSALSALILEIYCLKRFKESNRA